MRSLVIVLTLAAGLMSAETATAQSTNQPASGAASAAARNDYTDGKSWLCRPGRQDACAIDLTTTVVAAEGKLTREKWSPDSRAPIDCFYWQVTLTANRTEGKWVR